MRETRGEENEKEENKEIIKYQKTFVCVKSIRNTRVSVGVPKRKESCTGDLAIWQLFTKC